MESSSATRKHLGHVFIDCMRQYPDAVCQIDAATGEEETCLSVLSRSIQLAKCFRKFGLKPGDILALGGRNHLDLHIPYYAALLNGLPITGVDPYFNLDKIMDLFTITKPKIAFCQKELYDDYMRAIKNIGLDTKVITFDGQDNLKQFIESYNEDDDTREFEPADFDTNNVFAFVIGTSGTIGDLKAAAFKHDAIIRKLEVFKRILTIENGGVRVVSLNLSPVQWISGMANALVLPVLHQTKLQTSKPYDIDHIIGMINKYKPIYILLSPILATTLFNHREEIDFTCFRIFIVSGSKVFPYIKEQLQQLCHKDVPVVESYGLTETFGPITFPLAGTPLDSCGVVLPPHVIKLIDPDTGKEITAPNVIGELCVKELIFTEYYNNPQATAAVFTQDGFIKTGDLLYRDENYSFFFVDRIKSIIKGRNHNVVPAELEAVIFTHPSVRAVCVCAVGHKRESQLAAACIELKRDCHATEQEIKDLVASKLATHKHLHGGVVFVDDIPTTSSGKIARGKVQELMYKTLHR